jgi:hypothetical protein
MKRTLFIIGGLVIICLLAGVWAYFLFFGTPNPDGGIFANFNLGNTDDPTVVLPAIEPEPTQPLVDVTSPDRLRQLTTQPVAGFAEVMITASSTPEIRYIEAGTGHIYSIDLETGEEVRVSATTIPLTNTGALTPNGQFAMMQSGSGIGSEHVIGIISSTSDELRNFAIPGTITSFAATAENTFVYAAPAGNSLIVRAYNPSANTVAELFQIPFRDATIAWGTTEAGPHYVYPQTTSRLEGYVYSYTDGVAARESASGFGLSAVGSSAGYIFSEVQNGEYNTYATNKPNNETDTAPLTIIPEKCVFAQTDAAVAICGIALTEYPFQMPDPWYKGEVRTSDDLWEYSLTSQSASLLISPENATGRQLDIIRPQFGINDANLYFQNKIDQTLWIYEYNPFTN